MATETLVISHVVEGQTVFIQVLSSTLVSEFVTRWLEFGSMIYDKRVDAVRLELELPSSPQFNVFAAVADTIDEEPVWIDCGTLSGAKIKNIRIPDAKFFKFRFVDVTLTSPWKITAIEFYGRPLGKRKK